VTTTGEQTTTTDPVTAVSTHAGHRADAVDGVVPALVCTPDDVRGVQAVVRDAAASGRALVASGRGRHLDIGEAPARCDVVLRLDRVARVVEHHAADMTVTVEAGCTLAALETVLAETGQWLPIDPPAPADTTIGGMIAANLSGPLRASQGTVRDLLLGLRWVSASGELLSSGGRVVKNVAGYDLHKAHVGALGTLGIVVEATFKVRPRPAAERALVVGCDDPRAAVATALAARDVVEPSWLEVASGDVLGIDAPCAVAVGWLGVVEELDAAEERVRTVLASERTTGEPATHDGADAAALRAHLAELALAPAAAVLRLSTLPGALGDDLVHALAALGDSRARFAAHAMNGVARIVVEQPERVAPAVAVLRPSLAARGGAVVVERAPTSVKHELAAYGGVFGDPGAATALMRRLKDAFDPQRVLAPGRFVAGI
jgi:glycolate oxidase FAD binding subunit